MTTITAMRSENDFRASNRRALTLIEIMASILVLSIGLVGVLAAIPFGGMRMAQMNEADNSAGMGRNAVRLLKFYGWVDPDKWLLYNNDNSGYPSVNTNALYNDGNLNLTYPFFVDPIGKTPGNYFPEFYTFAPDNGFPVFFTRVSPKYEGFTHTYWDARYERDFYLQEIVDGYVDSEDESELRPRVETELNSVTIPNPLNTNIDATVGSDEIDSISGRHSWLATITPRANSDPFYNCSQSNVVSANYQVAVFQDRIPGDEKAFTAELEGSGYQGGVVTVDLTTTLTSAALAGYFKDGEKDSDPISRNRVVEQFETTRYIMLFGQDDVPEDGNYAAFAKWYKIANYSVVQSDGNGVPTKLRLNLVGENTPKNWAQGGKISALFFPGVIGVYSGTTTF